MGKTFHAKQFFMFETNIDGNIYVFKVRPVSGFDLRKIDSIDYDETILLVSVLNMFIRILYVITASIFKYC